MRNKILITAMAIIAALPLLTSCKSSEENYRVAYEKAKRRQAESESIDSTIYGRIRNQASNATLRLDGRDVEVTREFVVVTKDQGDPAPRRLRYNVVAAQFKQLFHARSMSKRLAEHGYSGAFILETREPLYYVVAYTTDDLARAVAVSDSLAADPPIRLQEGVPWILWPVGAP